MDAELLWLEKDPNTLLMRKDCIDAFVGGIQKDGSNTVSKWVSQNNVQQVLLSPLTQLLTFRSFKTSHYEVSVLFSSQLSATFYILFNPISCFDAISGELQLLVLRCTS